jgi:hypothetical protein
MTTKIKKLIKYLSTYEGKLEVKKTLYILNKSIDTICFYNLHILYDAKKQFIKDQIFFLQTFQRVFQEELPVTELYIKQTELMFCYTIAQETALYGNNFNLMIEKNDNYNIPQVDLDKGLTSIRNATFLFTIRDDIEKNGERFSNVMPTLMKECLSLITSYDKTKKQIQDMYSKIDTEIDVFKNTLEKSFNWINL